MVGVGGLGELVVVELRVVGGWRMVGGGGWVDEWMDG